VASAMVWASVLVCGLAARARLPHCCCRRRCNVRHWGGRHHYLATHQGTLLGRLALVAAFRRNRHCVRRAALYRDLSGIARTTVTPRDDRGCGGARPLGLGLNLRLLASNPILDLI